VKAYQEGSDRPSDTEQFDAHLGTCSSSSMVAAMTSKRALITGCSTGIGRATAVDLHARGYEVIATARRPETIEDLEVVGRIALDVDSDESVANVVAEAGPIDVLVNNAGFGVEGPIETVPLDEVRRMFETNVFGSARMIQAFLPGMRERGTGTIVNVTSTAAIAAPPLGGYYAATKFAMEAISEALKLEVGHFGIRVFAIEPGVIETSFGSNALDHRAEPGPYEELGTLWTKAMETLGGGQVAPGPELVATAIATALESDGTQLRWPVGQDAELIAAARTGTDYDEFVAGMRTVLNLDW
jgi:NAD(P)-dependent dehydrogenase (short-subunit alcohol dehydrogenase family)